MENYTLSDLATATGGNAFGGNSAWLIILFVLIFGMNGYNRNGDFGQYATAASQQEILFGQQFQNLDNKIDRLGNGIADATFALNNSIKDGNAAVAGRVVDEGRALQTSLCNAHSDINSVTIAQTQKILDAIAQNKIDSLQAQVTELKTQNMFCGVPKINPYAYGVYQYPNGCGCGYNQSI